jgi:ABC-type polysaccharide/polyol phosphate export permease
MTEADRNWWEQMRARGRGSFIFREGILRYGTRVGFSLVMLLGLFIAFFTRDSIHIFQLALAWLFSSVFFGSLIGFVLWTQHE